ncbi:DUF4240 domain-containing protein [Calidifontibacter sp. DB0510]|uniref:DUF4240 domain-containing protein n=1 Tax=Metallococcus carri TaxID=1656884 RepID=A0A967E9J6_9MICO|nr:DUF4240 domain-containing protein [Metallococcus carri]NHN55275.1 DUF4240 domain-containing protein [Metallococcus carri]NOP36352.1 DUF4240 domain-containing protein [Calidifontibacter sp. DB2511S]
MSFFVQHYDPYGGRNGGPPKEVRRLLQARAAIITEHSRLDDGWTVWAGRRNRRLQLDVFLSEKPASSGLKLDGDWWYADLNLGADHFSELPVGPQVGLRLVSTIEAVLVALSHTVDDPPPTALKRTKREIEWLAAGGVDPGPGAVPQLRVHRARCAMSVERFWGLIAATSDNETGALLLSSEEADKFTARMRLLVDDLDSSDHMTAAEVAMGWVSDDVWENVRASVVSLGRDAYEQVRTTPAALTELITATDAFEGGESDRGEGLLYLHGTD